MCDPLIGAGGCDGLWLLILGSFLAGIVRGFAGFGGQIEGDVKPAELVGEIDVVVKLMGEDEEGVAFLEVEDVGFYADGTPLLQADDEDEAVMLVVFSGVTSRARRTTTRR